MYAHYYDFLQFSKTKGLAGAEGPCRRSAGAAFLLEDLDPECKAKMMKVIVVNNFLTKLHTVQKTHVIAVFLLAGSYFISTSFQEHEKIFHLSPSKQWEISK